jgi:hypothetical protein
MNIENLGEDYDYCTVRVTELDAAVLRNLYGKPHGPLDGVYWVVQETLGSVKIELERLAEGRNAWVLDSSQSWHGDDPVGAVNLVLRDIEEAEEQMD